MFSFGNTVPKIHKVSSSSLLHSLAVLGEEVERVKCIRYSRRAGQNDGSPQRLAG